MVQPILKKALIAMLYAATATVFSQGTLSGKILDGTTNDALPGANIIVKGTDVGTVTDFDGNFTLKVSSERGVLKISYIGYQTKTIPFTVKEGSTTNLGVITLEVDAESLEEIVVVGSGLITIAKDRETPVAASTIRAGEIQRKLGNQEFPEAMKTVPGVFVEKGGGGFGDATINIRGFGQENISVMINGQPVNDMENGAVYWSNWSGLRDVASIIQVQRGLGSSKIGIAAVGGTVNIITKATDKKEGGFAKGSFGNDGYFKTTASYATGLNKKGWGASILLSHEQGDGYIEGTKGRAQSYFISLGYKPSETHSFNIMITGAPQWHHSAYRATIKTFLKYGRRYNSNWGWLNGEEFSFEKNFYHKPIASFNWDWNISEKTSLATVLYASWGRGGGSGPLGLDFFRLPKDEKTGLLRLDDLVKSNQGKIVPGFTYKGNPIVIKPYDGDLDNRNAYYKNKQVAQDLRKNANSGTIRRASINSHNWYGALLNFTHKTNENWTYNLGLDLRTYRGLHYRVLTALLGADAYLDKTDVNSAGVFTSYEAKTDPYSFGQISKAPKIDRNYDSKVKWGALFGQLEYKNEIISSFLQASLSNQSYKRFEYMEVLSPDRESDRSNKWGANIKAGINWNINEANNVFFNVGFYSRQPFFLDLYPFRYTPSANVLSELKNEKVIGLEAGYGFKISRLDMKLNLYRTVWKDRAVEFNNDPELRQTSRGNIDELHQGVELEFVGVPADKLKISGMLSYGFWEYLNNVTVNTYDRNGNLVSKGNELYLKGIKIGGAPQFQTRLGIRYFITEKLLADMDWFFNDRLYAFVDADEFDKKDNKGLLRLPSYHLFDIGISYEWDFRKKTALLFRFNVNNLFDTMYISKSYSNDHVSDDSDTKTWKGISEKNWVNFGFGRTWNFAATFSF